MTTKVYKVFKYSLPELKIQSKNIYMDVYSFTSIDDLKKTISSELQISDECLRFKNPPKEKLKDISNNAEFVLEVSVYHDISIRLPGFKTIQIKDGYKQKFADIIPFIEKEKIYFSNDFIKRNISLFSSNKEISLDGYPFISKYSTFFELKFKSNSVILKYHGFEFNFTEYEGSYEAKNLIKKVFPSSTVTIKDSNGNEYIKYFMSIDKYQISIEIMVEFFELENEYSSKWVKINYSTTVSDVQKQLAAILRCYTNEKIQPENLYIYDNDKRIIENSNKPISNHQDFDKKFYYKIKDTKHEKDIKIEDKKEPIIRTYFYSIPEIGKSVEMIEVNINECQTIDDLKKKIASLCNISYEQLFIDKLKSKELKDYEDYADIQISIRSLNPDLDILLPNEEKVKIKDCYKMNFDEIIKSLEKEGYYYSPTCISKNFHLYLSGQELPREGYPLLSIKSTSKLEIKLTGNFIELKYDKFYFTFSDNEYYTDAIALIQKAYPSEKIFIQNSHGEKEIQLKSKERYIIRIAMTVKFSDYFKSYEYKYIKVDKFDTISRVQAQLAEKLSNSFKQIKPESLIIYDYSKKNALELSKKIIDFIKSNKEFYYKIGSYKPEEINPPPTSDPLIETKDNEKFHIKKCFFISIPDILIENEIMMVDIDIYKTIDDLKKLIASKFNISDNQLHFEDHAKKELKEYYNNYAFKLTISSLNPDLDILLPNEKKVKIKDCYKMNFDEIIKSLEKEGYYYSPTCISKNFHLYLSGQELPREGYPLLSIKSTSKLEIKLTGNFIELKYDKFYFTFSDNENNFDAKNLIKKRFSSDQISIRDYYGTSPSQLKSYEKYIIKIKTTVDFIDIDNSYLVLSIPVDYMDTVSSIQKKISETIKAENIIIYKDKKKIDDVNKLLISYPNLQKKIYFSIKKKSDTSDYPVKSAGKDELKDDHKPYKIDRDIEETIPSPSKETIKIIVICLKTNEKQFYPIRENIPLDTTIGDIEKMISNKYDIKDKIILKYETEDSFEPIESTKKIEEVKDLIKVTKPSGKVDYLIYYEIQSKSKAEAKEMKDKAEDETKTSPKAKIEDKKRYKFDKPSKTATDDSSSEEEDLYKKPLTINRKKEDWSPKTKDDKKEPMKAKKETPKKPTPTKTYYDEENEGGIKTLEPKNRRKPSASKYKPKLTPTTPESSPKKEDRVSTSSTYKFEFKGKKKQIKMRDDSTIEMQLPTIKKEFDIPSEEVLKLEFNGDDDDSEPIKSIKFKMSTFKNGTIQISLPIKPKIRSKTKQEKPSPKRKPSPESSSSSSESQPKLSIKVPPNSNKIKYIIQVGYDDPEVIELKKDATVKTMKEKIAEDREVEDAMSIKITFAGKELLNDILLEPMKIGDTTLFVYIPTTEEVFLQTAKALRLPRNKDDDDDDDD